MNQLDYESRMFTRPKRRAYTPPANVLTLFDDRPGQHHVPSQPTEREAAHLVAPRTGTQRRTIFESLIARPLSDEQIVTRTRIRLQSVCARRNELVADGLVCDSGKRRLGSAGVDVIAWRLTAKGRDVAAQMWAQAASE